MQTSVAIGIGLGFVAMLSWGFGDFLIQKSSRKLGDWETLFYISLFGLIVFAPFVVRSLPAFIQGNVTNIFILLGSAIIIFVAALLDFEALKEGRLAIVEPIFSFEIPVAAMMAYFVIGERITWIQWTLIILLLVSLVMVGYRKEKRSGKFFDRGVIVGILAAVVMGAANFFMGWGGRVTDPILVNFFVSVFIAIFTGIYLVAKGKNLFSDLKKNYPLILTMSISDQVAWVAFVFALTLAPIAVATALSESYIIIAVLLGLFVNREKVQYHQKLGLITAVITAICLAVVTTS